MKTLHLLIVAAACFLMGCNEQKPAQVLSVCIFEPIDPDKVSSASDLAFLETYADAAYAPNKDATHVSKNQLDKIGYKLRMSSNQHLSSIDQRIFNQGLQSHPKSVQDVAIGKLASSPDGSYELSVYVGARDSVDMDEEFVTSKVLSDRSGTMNLPNGWIASWRVKPKEG